MKEKSFDDGKWYVVEHYLHDYKNSTDMHRHKEILEDLLEIAENEGCNEDTIIQKMYQSESDRDNIIAVYDYIFKYEVNIVRKSNEADRRLMLLKRIRIRG